MHCAVCVRGTLRSLRPRYTAQSASSTVCSTAGGGGYRTWDQELEAKEEMEEILVEDSSTRTSSKGATAGEMESMMDLKSPAETTAAAAAAAAAEDSPEDEEGELQEQKEQEVVAGHSQHQQHQQQSCMDQASNGPLMQSYNEDEDEDEEEIERSRHFAQALKELKSLRPQLYSAAEYCESSYLFSDQKQV